LALGAYPTVSLAKARKRREEARVLLSPSQAKRDDRQARQGNPCKSMQGKLSTCLEKDNFPNIGNKTISSNQASCHQFNIPDLAPK